MTAEKKLAQQRLSLLELAEALEYKRRVPAPAPPQFPARSGTRLRTGRRVRRYR